MKIILISNEYSKIIEENNSDLEMATVHTLRPCTKHITIQYHDFINPSVNDARIKTYEN